jgi:hypothetical protein
MRVVGLLNWFDEAPSWLQGAVSSIAPILDHVIAVDGAYMLFPHAAHQHRSGFEQAEAIEEAAYAAGIGVTVHSPAEAWKGEVEKRSFMFQMGEQITTEDDWYAIIDADEVVRQIPDDFLDDLAKTEAAAVEVAMWERTDVLEDRNKAIAAQSFVWEAQSTTPMRKMFKALRGLRVVGNHYTYATPGRRILWSAAAANTREPALRRMDYVLEHRNSLRPQHRRKVASEYYQRRDEMRIEREPCWRCDRDAEYAYRTAFVNWRRDEEGSLIADPVMICEKCIDGVTEDTEAEIRALGADPNLLVRVP